MAVNVMPVMVVLMLVVFALVVQVLVVLILVVAKLAMLRMVRTVVLFGEIRDRLDGLLLSLFLSATIRFLYGRHTLLP